MEKFLSSKASLFQTMLFFILISISLSFSSDTTTKSFDVVKSTQNALNALTPLSKEALQQQLLKKTLIISSYPRTSVDHINVYHDYESLTLARLQHDLHRVRAIGKNEYPTRLVKEYSGEYLVRVGFGTPPQDYMFVIMDTGSHLTWIQCEPCQKHCLEQIGDIFDPSASSSYKLLTCIFDDDCLLVREHKVCNWDRDVCEYEVVYVDGSFSNGDYVNETIHFHDSSSFPNLTMGCGQDQGPPFGYAGGVLGMSYHPLSFPFQIQADTFSFCLVDRDTIDMSTLDYNVQTPPDSITVPFLVSTGYYIKVKGFIVGGQTLNIPPEAFSSTLHTFGKVIVDSGAVYSYLFPQAYEILREAFRKEAKNRLKRIYGSFSKFETCYDMEDWQVAIVPSMWIMFSDDKKLELNVLNYLHVYKPGVYCLAFLPSLKTNTNPYPQSIFGNTLLQTTRVTYDLVNMLLSFTPDSC